MVFMPIPSVQNEERGGCNPSLPPERHEADHIEFGYALMSPCPSCHTRGNCSQNYLVSSTGNVLP
jgi:hypothetical protein